MLNATIHEILSLIGRGQKIKIFDWSISLPVIFTGKSEDVPPYLKDRHVVQIASVAWYDACLCIVIAKEL